MVREDEDDPLSPIQRRQVQQVRDDFPEVFMGKPGVVRGFEHHVSGAGWCKHQSFQSQLLSKAVLNKM